MFCTFWLRNVLRATTACNFSSLIWPDGSAPAALASLFFDQPAPQIIRKNTVNRTLPFRAPASSFFSLFLFSALLTSCLLLSDSSHLCLSICPYCRKFDFKTSFDNVFCQIFFHPRIISAFFKATMYSVWENKKCTHEMNCAWMYHNEFPTITSLRRTCFLRNAFLHHSCFWKKNVVIN